MAAKIVAYTVNHLEFLVIPMLAAISSMVMSVSFFIRSNTLCVIFSVVFSVAFSVASP